MAQPEKKVTETLKRLEQIEKDRKLGKQVDDDEERRLKAEVRYHKIQKGMAIAQEKEEDLSDTKQQERRQALDEEQMFLQYQMNQQKKKTEENLRDALDPVSATASSNLDSIMAMLNDGKEGKPSRERSRDKRRSTVLDDGTDVTNPDEFTVDTRHLLEKRGGRPEPQHPMNVAIDTDMLDDFNDPLDDSDHDGQEEPDEGIRGFGGAAMNVQKRTNQKNNALSAPTAKRGRQRLKAAAMGMQMALPIHRKINKSNAHDLAQLFNTLITNNIVKVNTEDHPEIPSKTVNTLRVLSPTDGYRLRSHLRTAEDQSSIFYTSREWSLKQALMERILAEEIDIDYLASMQSALEDVFRDMSLAHELIFRKDRELARTRSKCEALENAVKDVLMKNKLRREQTLKLALDIDDTLGKMGPTSAVAPHIRRLLGIRSQRQRGTSSAFASFYDSKEDDVEDDESNTILLTELKEILGKLGQLRAKQDDQDLRSADMSDDVMSPMALTSPSAAFGSGGGDGMMQLEASSSMIMSPTTDQRISFSPQVFSPGAAMARTSSSLKQQNAGVSRSALLAAGGIDDMHNNLVAKLQRKIDRRVKRAEVEMKMAAMERMVMEAEDTMSSVSCIFRLGDNMYCKLHDVLKVLTVEQKEQIFGSAAVEGVRMADSVSVVCPCCKFEFDPSKPASEYRDKIMRRRGGKLAGDTVAGAKGGANMHKGGKKPKMVRAEHTVGSEFGTDAFDFGPDNAQLEALQEMVQDLERELAESKEDRARLEGELDMKNANIQQIQQELKETNADLRDSKHSLNKYIDDISDELDAAKATIENLNAEKAKLQQKVTAVQKAAEHAFEQLDVVQEYDRKVEEMVGLCTEKNCAPMTLDTICKTYFRKYHEVCDQLKKAGKNPIAMYDMFAGGDSPIPHFAEGSTQLFLSDMIEQVDVHVQAVAKLAIGATQTGDDNKPKHAEVQTDEEKGSVEFNLKTALGGDYKTVDAKQLKETLFKTLLEKSKDGNNVKEFISVLNSKEMQEQGQYEEQLLEVERSKSKRLLREQEEQHSLSLKEMKEKLYTMERDAADARNDAISAEKKLNRVGADRKLWDGKTPGETNLDIGGDLLVSDDGHGGDGAGGSGGNNANDKTVLVGGSTEVRIVDRLLMGDDDDLGFQAVYTDSDDDEFMNDGWNARMAKVSAKYGSGDGRPHMVDGKPTNFPPIRSTNINDLQAEEKARRRLIMQQYNAFCIPLPMLLALLSKTRSEVTSVISAARKITRKVNEIRDVQRRSTSFGRKAIRLPGITPGEGLGVTTELPGGWYYDPKEAHVFPSEEDPTKRRDAKEWRPLNVQEFPPLVPSERNPHDGSYIKTHHYRQGIAVPTNASSPQNQGAGSPMGSPHSPMRGRRYTTVSQAAVNSTSSLVIKNIAARLTYNRLQKRMSLMDSQQEDAEATAGGGNAGKEEESAQPAAADMSPTTTQRRKTLKVQEKESEELLLNLMRQQLHEQMARYQHTQDLKKSWRKAHSKSPRPVMDIASTPQLSDDTVGIPEDIQQCVEPGSIKLGTIVGGLRRKSLQNITVKGFGAADARKWQQRDTAFHHHHHDRSESVPPPDLSAKLQRHQVVGSDGDSNSMDQRVGAKSATVLPTHGKHHLQPLEKRGMALASANYQEVKNTKREPLFFKRLSERLELAPQPVIKASRRKVPTGSVSSTLEPQ